MTVSADPMLGRCRVWLAMGFVALSMVWARLAKGCGGHGLGQPRAGSFIVSAAHSLRRPRAGPAMGWAG